MLPPTSTRIILGFMTHKSVNKNQQPTYYSIGSRVSAVSRKKFLEEQVPYMRKLRYFILYADKKHIIHARRVSVVLMRYAQFCRIL